MSELKFCYEMTHWISGKSNQFSGNMLPPSIGPGGSGQAVPGLRGVACGLQRVPTPAGPLDGNCS